jgi:hypothetical protein
MTTSASSLIPGFLLLTAVTLGAQPAAVTRPAPPAQPIEVGRAHEIVIYRDRNFDGPAVSIAEDQPNLRLAWAVSSVRVHSGVWELCERPNYQGACLTLSASSSNLGHRTVQSARAIRSNAGWRVLGDAQINRVGWDHRTIQVRGNPSVSALRFCAERTRIRFRDARARFTNNRFQTLRVPSQVDIGSCTDAFLLDGWRRNISSVDVTASTAGVVSSSNGLIRLEGR